MKRFGLSLIIFLTLISSCNNDSIPPDTDTIGLDFFPLETGAYRIYQVEQIDFDPLESDTSIFQLQEMVVDSFLNAENDLTYVLHRFSRPDEMAEWQLDSVWTTRRTTSIAVVVENNVPVIRMVFPIAEGTEWDGNGLNTRGEQSFRYDEVFEPKEVNGITYDNTTTVVQSEEANFVMQDERREVYAQGIGLIQREFRVLNFCTRQECLRDSIIDSGQIQLYDLIEYGEG